MELYLITHNKNKIKEFKLLLEPEFKIDVLEFDYPELRSDDSEEIVKLAAKQLADKLNKTVIVEDSGFFIKALNGFPGTCTAYIYQRIGNKGFLKLMKGVKKRAVYYKSAIGFCQAGKEAISFFGVEEGTLALKEKGKKGWGQDPIFIPKGKKKTYGQLRTANDVNLFRKRAIIKLKEFLENNF